MIRSSHQSRLILIGIIVLAAVLRFLGLSSESLWLDEAGIIDLTNYGLGGWLANWTQGPLFLILIGIVRDIAGTTEFTLRFLPAVFGILCVPAIYLLCKRIFGQTAAMISALFMAVNPYAIHYSQDARPYTLFLLGSLLALNYSIRLAQIGRWRDVIGFALSVQVVLYSHPFGVFLLPALAGVFFVSWIVEEPQVRRMRLRRFLIAASAAAVLFCPQIIRLGTLFFHKANTETVARWILVPGLGDLIQTIRQYFMMPALAYAVIAIIALALIDRRTPARKERAGFVLIGSLLLCCLLFPWAVSKFITPIYVSRYTTPALTAFILALGWAAAAMPRGARALIIVIVLMMTIRPLYGYYTKTDKDPWRQTADILRQHVRAGDLVVEDAWYIKKPLDFYFRAPQSVWMIAPTNENDLRHVAGNARRIWLVHAYGGELSDLSRRIESVLRENYQAAGTVEDMDKRIRRNRWAYHVAHITVTMYVPKTSVDSEPLTFD